MSSHAHKVVTLAGAEKDTRPQPATAGVLGAAEIAKLERFRDRYYVVCSLSTAQIDSLRQLQVTTGKSFDSYIDDILALPGAPLPHRRD